MLKYPEHRKRKVLIAPLDWGLGHATRMMPVIRAFQGMGWTVELASGGLAYDLLKKRFPDMPVYRIPSYNIRYSRHPYLMVKLFAQAPAMWKGMKAEHKWLQNYVNEKSPDLIISDDRFGMYHKQVQSWYVTHQIRVLMPWYMKPAQPLVRSLHSKIIKSYDKCLVPDLKLQGLSGLLAHRDRQFPFSVEYTGILSRFYDIDPEIPGNVPDVLAVISGPEPQRSILENKLKALYENFEGSVFIVSGRPGLKDIEQHGSVNIYPHLPAEKLSGLMKAAPVLICRSGYSSLMDLFHLERKAILIPTPGQTEQSYLGRYFRDNFNFTVISQKNLGALKDVCSSFCGEWKHPEFDPDLTPDAFFQTLLK